MFVSFVGHSFSVGKKYICLFSRQFLNTVSLVQRERIIT